MFRSDENRHLYDQASRLTLGRRCACSGNEDGTWQKMKARKIIVGSGQVGTECTTDTERVCTLLF
jgi:hypothetical protein